MSQVKAVGEKLNGGKIPPNLYLAGGEVHNDFHNTERIN